MCLKSKKILVIDEDCQSGRTIRNFLKSLNFDVCLAGSGAAGIQKSFEFKPDLILCDIDMLPISGLNVFHVLKESTTGEVPAPFIFMSTSSEMMDFRFVMDLGADDYILKPIDLNVLKRSVENQFCKLDRINEFCLKRFKSFINLSPNGIFLFDNFKLSDSNTTFLKMTGMDPEKINKCRIEDLFADESILKIKSTIQNCVTGRSTSICEEVFLQIPNGVKQEISFSVAPYNDYFFGTTMVGVVIPKKQIEKIANHDRQVSELMRILKSENIYVSNTVVKQLNDVLKHQNENPATLNLGLFSKRENEVLHLSFEGLPSKVIADKLSISGRTVEKFRSKLMEKTGSNNMIEVINYAVRNKLVACKVLLPFMMQNMVEGGLFGML
jgi:PAS domain S-box-containing protein